MSVADANRFRELETRVDNIGIAMTAQRLRAENEGATSAGDTRVEALTEVVATLQRRIVALEKQQQETALFLTRKLGSNAAAR